MPFNVYRNYHPLLCTSSLNEEKNVIVIRSIKLTFHTLFVLSEDNKIVHQVILKDMIRCVVEHF